MENISTSSVTLLDLIKLTQDIASLNAVYLSISVGIILALGGAFYLFSLKPLQEKITRQEEQLDLEKKKNEEKLKQIIESLKEAQKNSLDQIDKSKKELTNIIENKISKEVNLIKKMANTEKLNSLWDKHYLWGLGSTKVPQNELSVLIESLEKSIEYKMFVASPELHLDEIDITLNEIKREHPLSESDKKDLKEMYDNLVNTLSKLSGHDEKKKELIEKAKIVLL